MPLNKYALYWQSESVKCTLDRDQLTQASKHIVHVQCIHGQISHMDEVHKESVTFHMMHLYTTIIIYIFDFSQLPVTTEHTDD